MTDFIGTDVGETLTGTSGVDRLEGRGGDDILNGGLGADTILGGDGDDRTEISLLDAGDIIDGGAGNDLLTFSGLSSTTAINFNFADFAVGGTGTLLGVNYSGIEFVEFGFLSSAADTIVYNATYTRNLFILGQAGNDSVTGGSGGDTLIGEDGNDTLFGEAGTDNLRGDAGDDALSGGAGADTLSGSDGMDTLDGGDGNDTLNGDAENDTIAGGLGNDSLNGGAGNDILSGGDGNDTLVDGGGIDRLEGGAGDDSLTINVLTGAPTANGGEGNDRLTLQLSGMTSGVSFTSTSFVSGVAGTLFGVNYSGIEVLELGTLTNFNDTVTYDAGFSGALSLNGGAGDDVLTGGSGSNSLAGGAGNDTLNGGANFDSLTGGDGDDILNGGDGNDRFTPGAGNDTLDGGAGTSDLVFLTETAGTLSVNLATRSAVGTAGGNDSLSNIERIILSAPTVNFTGTDGNDFVQASGTDITLTGGLGDDVYLILNGDAVVIEAAGGGNDTVTTTQSHYLGANIENLNFELTTNGDLFLVGNDGANRITGNNGSNLLLGGAGDDIISDRVGNDAMFGEGGNDNLDGGAGVDYLVGGQGNDTLNGNTDPDSLYGEAGDDTITGGSDFVTDIFVGGDGNDILFANSGLGDYDLIDGGAGDDQYHVDTGDDLTFEAVGGGTDTVFANINAVNAGVYLYANVENLVLQGSTAFGVGNELANSLTGNAVGNYLLGGAGDDVLTGGRGGDVLFGEQGADRFIFNRGDGGDVIGDFQIGVDKIDLRGFGVSNFTALRGLFVQDNAVGGMVLGSGDIVILLNVQMSQLTANDFILG